MNQSKISRRQQCNIHTDQQVISVCLTPNCYRSVLCIECINDPDIHPTEHNKIISIEEFCMNVDKVNAKKGGISDDFTIIEELKERANLCNTSIKTFEESTELEKKMIEDSINELISCFVMKCHTMKQQVCQDLDKQVEIFKRNYKSFTKAVKRIPESEPIIMNSSIFDKMNKSVTYNQIDDLVKGHQKDLSPAKNAHKEVDENLIKLKTVAQTLKDNSTYPCSTLLTNTNLETIKASLTETIDKFFIKYLKLQNENLPIQLNTAQCDSKILKDKSSLELVNSFLKEDYKEPVFGLLYRGSRDGLAAANFHRRCDRKGPTLTLVNSQQGKSFGGYTDVDWDIDEKYKESKNSFLFSIDHKEKYQLKQGHHQYAIKGSKDLGPCFGGGHDLRISQDFQKEECSGYIGFSYESREKYSKDVYGDTAFFLTEIEVYKVSEGYEEEEEKQVKANNQHNYDDWPRLLEDAKEDDDIKRQQEKDVEKTSMSQIASHGDLDTVLNWVDPKRNFIVQLAYRGSRDGYSSDSFHKRCDEIGPTLTLIKSKKSEQVFGGFTKQSWNKSNQPAKCQETFVFSLTKKKKFPIVDSESAIFRSESAGPVFGNGDIYICSDCNTKKESYSNLGVGFDAGDLDNSVVFFAGEESFKVDDIEVFQVTFMK